MHIINENAQGQIQNGSYSQEAEKKKERMVGRNKQRSTVLVCLLFLKLKVYTHGYCCLSLQLFLNGWNISKRTS